MGQDLFFETYSFVNIFQEVAFMKVMEEQLEFHHSSDLPPPFHKVKGGGVDLERGG